MRRYVAILLIAYEGGDLKLHYHPQYPYQTRLSFHVKKSEASPKHPIDWENLIELGRWNHNGGDVQ